MITDALRIIKKSLDQYLSFHFNLDTGCCVVNNIIKPNGTIPSENKNKIVINLIDTGIGIDLINSDYQIKILFASNFDNYFMATQYLDGILKFLKNNSVISAPNLPSSISNLELAVDSMSYKDTHYLWATIGASYIPSIVCKININATKNINLKK